MLRQIMTEIRTGIGQGMISSARMICLPGRSSNIRVAIRPTAKLKKTDRKVKARFQTKILLSGSRKPALPTKSVKADGTAIYVELSFAITKDGHGAVIGAMAVARDITERFESDRVMRRELRELKAKAADPA